MWCSRATAATWKALQAPFAVRTRWTQTAILVLSVAAVGGGLLHAFPPYRALTLFGLYTVISLVAVSPFVHEIPLLYCAKLFSPHLVAIVATAGTLIACIIDYWVLTPVIHHHTVRSRYENVAIYRRLTAAFARSPFWTLVIVAYSPIPLVPFKLLSISVSYPIARYAAAMAIGRGVRYYMLAWLGRILLIPNWLLLAAAILLALAFLGRLVLRRGVWRE